jgi:hypothetical protein
MNMYFFMYVCMYVCIWGVYWYYGKSNCSRITLFRYVHVCVCCVYICVCMCKYVCMYVCVCIYNLENICICMYVCMSVLVLKERRGRPNVVIRQYLGTYIYMYTYIYIYGYRIIYGHIYKHIYIYIYLYVHIGDYIWQAFEKGWQAIEGCAQKITSDRNTSLLSYIQPACDIIMQSQQVCIHTC